MSILSLFHKVGAAYKNDRSKKLAAHVLLIGGIAKRKQVLWRLGGGGRQNPTKYSGAPPLTVIKIVKYCGVRGGGHWRRGRERQNPTKLIASLISVIKIVKYFGIVGGGALKSYKVIMAPPLSVIKIVKYCGKKYNAYKQYNCILPVTN